MSSTNRATIFPMGDGETTCFSVGCHRRRVHSMKQIALLPLVFVVACAQHENLPTSPTPVPVVVNQPPAVVVAPPLVTPPVSTPPPNPLLSDPRFNLAFYRQMALDGYEQPGNLQPLRRQTQAPRIYLRTIHDVTGATIDAITLNQTSAALESVAGSLTGVFGLAGIERGTGTKEGEVGWVTVHFTNDPERRFCGRGSIGGGWLDLYTNTDGCRCSGGAAVMPLIVKHEMGHVLGFRHTDSVSDLMHSGGHTTCDMNPSDREMFAARVAYSQPNGSLDPK